MKPAAKQYLKDFIVGMGLYIIILISANIALRVWDLSLTIKIILALACAAPVLLIIKAVLRFAKTFDELQRKKQMEATLIAFILVGMGTFTYGFLEMIGFPRLPIIWAFPLLYMTQGLAMIYVTRKYG
jgi:hypothetical protein